MQFRLVRQVLELDGVCMLSRINVDGFKSLKDFSLHFGKGLNVLIGPNGAGKSNICQSLALLGAAANNELIEYILSIGGAKNIFKSSGDNLPGPVEKSFEIRCMGSVPAPAEKNTNTTLIYQYWLEVSVGESLGITGEALRIHREVPDRKRKVVFSIKKNKKQKVTARVYNPELAGPMNEFIFDSEDERNKPVKINWSSQTESFLEFFSTFYFFVHLVYEDLRSLKVFNIDPHIAKKSSDILEPLTMLSDGRRLANAIYQLTKNEDPRLDELNAFMTDVMPRYKRLNSVVSSDGLARSFSITDIDDKNFDAKSLSDGTIKTLALMVGLAECSKGSVIVEEPENYLHPWACNLLVDYMRASFSGRSCVLTTHSETMLNAIKPAEIIVCTNEDGYTAAERLKDAKGLEAAVQQSGFGCGYHFISGGLGGVPL